MQLMHRFKVDWFVVAILTITLALASTNYTPGTILSGWDTLHPEFNLGLYWERITHVWQEYQGLGAPPAQSHAAEITRMPFLLLFSSLLPVELVRYAFIWLTMFLGPLGIYYYILHITRKEDNYTNFYKIHKVGAFIGALFYLLNVGTVQHYIVVFEMFAVKFAGLGFIFLYLTKYIDTGRRKHLGIFSIVILLSAGMAHTATLWYVFFAGLVGYIILLLATEFIFERKILLVHIKRGIIIASLTLFLNAFWIFPNIYYSLNYGGDVISSKIHRLFTEEAYLNNKDYGNPYDLALMKNFLFNWYVAEPIMDQNGRLVNSTFRKKLMHEWIQHFDNPVISTTGIIITLCAIIGGFFSFWNRNRYAAAIVPLWLGCAFFLLAEVPGISQITDWLREQNNLMKEVLRFPYTKLSIYYIFAVCVFFGYIIVALLRKIQQHNTHHAIVSAFFTYLISFFILCYSLPAFKGNYISSVIRVHMPIEYMEMFNQFSALDNQRILILPIHSQFGWVFYLWDNTDPPQVYQGAGFTWFGLKQPTLNREFDRWYFPNEQSFREFFYALYSDNHELFLSLLDKYNIKWIIVDKNVSNPGDPLDRNKLYYAKIREMLDDRSNIFHSYQFGPNIRVYSVDANNNQQAVLVKKRYDTIHPPFRWNYIDYVYAAKNDYISVPYNSKKNIPAGPPLESAAVFPARAIIDEQERIYHDLIDSKGTEYFIRSKITADGNGTFTSSIISTAEDLIPARVSVKAEGERRKLLHFQYLIPFLRNDTPPSDHVILHKETRQVVIGKYLFTIPEERAGLNKILGDMLVETKKPLVIELFDDKGTLGKTRAILPNLARPVQIPSNVLDLHSKVYSSNENRLTLEQASKEPIDCTVGKAQVLDKKIRQNRDGSVNIQYKTVNGILCDSFAFPFASQHIAYILSIRSKHFSGLPLRVCVKDTTNSQCIFNDELSKFKFQDTDYFIIPQFGRNGGYDISIRNISIGEVPSLNEIDQISLIPIPYTLLQSLAYMPDTYKEHESKPDNNMVTFIDKSSPTRYDALLRGVQPNDLITLDQAYEKGWGAYIIENPLANIAPLVFGKRLEKHVLYNNWQNAWVIPEENIESINRNTIRIVYLPQYLFVIGVILSVSAIFIAIRPDYWLNATLRKRMGYKI